MLQHPAEPPCFDRARVIVRNILEIAEVRIGVAWKVVIHLNARWPSDATGFQVHDGAVYWLDVSSARPYFTYKWRSKVFETLNIKNFEAMRVFFQTHPTTPALNPVPNTALVQTLAADQWGLVRVYADSNLVMTRLLVQGMSLP